MAPFQMGTPDWRRREGTSGVNLVTFTFANNSTVSTGVNDTMGFSNLIVSTVSTDPNAIYEVSIDYYADNLGTIFIADQSFVVPGNSSVSVKLPVVARYYKLTQTVRVAGNGTSVVYNFFGTMSDTENLLTQNTTTPLINVSTSIAAAGNTSDSVRGMWGGPAVFYGTNNVNTAFKVQIFYYDIGLAAFTFLCEFEPATGQSFINQLVHLPYAPLQVKRLNTDTVARTITAVLTAP